MGAVHVGIGHDDDLVVAQLGHVEGAFPFPIADAGADGGDHGADFGVLEHLVQARFLHIDELAANGQDRLELAVAPLLGRAACGVALDDVELGVGGVAVRAIGQLAGQTAAGERALAHRFARFAGRLARARRHQGLVHYLLGHRRVAVKEVHQPVVNDRGNNAVDFRVDQFDLGLRFETRVGQFDAQDADQPFAHVIARDVGVLFLEQLVGPGVLVDRAGQGAAEAGQVGAAVGVGNRVGKAENLVVVAVVVLHHAIHEHFLLLPDQHDGLGMKHLLVAPKLAHELDDAVLVEEGLLLVFDALIGQDDFHARIQEGQFAQTVGEDVELELGGDGEDGRIGLEGDQRARLFGFADDFQLFAVAPRWKAM